VEVTTCNAVADYDYAFFFGESLSGFLFPFPVTHLLPSRICRLVAALPIVSQVALVAILFVWGHISILCSSVGLLLEGVVLLVPWRIFVVHWWGERFRLVDITILNCRNRSSWCEC
jgi:hypothetical protein